MPYIDEEYYNKTFRGEPVDSADFPALCDRAGEIIEELTMYKVSEIKFYALPYCTQDRIKRAVCAQLEYLNANGGSDMDNGADLQSAGLGKFNYSKAADASGNTSQSIYSPRAIRLLAPTGLLYRGGGVY